MPKAFIIFFIFLLFLLLPIFYIGDTAGALETAQISDERLIVKFKSFTPGFLKENSVKKHSLKLDEALYLPNTYMVKIPKGKAGEIIQILKRELLIEYAEEDYASEKFQLPNDPHLSKQWALTKIQATQAWDKSHGSRDVDIAILDTGVNFNHPDLAGKIVNSVNCTKTNCPASTNEDPDGHGTHVAGIASAVTNNAQGIAGFSWDGRLLDVKVLDDSGNGYYSWIANGIVWATDNGAEVINLSLGGSANSLTLQNAVNYAWNKGVIVVAAAGNRGINYPTYPAYFTNVIAVAATTETDSKASYSSYGLWVDLAAPGNSIYSTYHSGYEYLSGTSMATPYVSGLAALVKGSNMNLSGSAVRQKIESTADKITGTGMYWAYGRINACRALDCGLSTPTPTPTVAKPTPTISTSVTNTPTLIPTLIITPTPIPSPTVLPAPAPTTKPLPWYCVYIPWHYLCK